MNEQQALDGALECVDLGWSVTPAYATAWRHKGTTNPAVVRQWAEEDPARGFWVLTGSASGIVGLEVIGRDGADRLERFRCLTDLPRTVEIGGGNRRTLLFRAPKPCPSGRVLPGLTLLGARGKFTAPGSVVGNGSVIWFKAHPEEMPVADLPAGWVLDLLFMSVSRPRANAA